MLHPLANTIQRYSWGSPDALRELYGFDNPDHAPMAELWMGAHPKAPSRIIRDGGETPLDGFIGEHPERTLGASAGRFDGRLPFLLKVLCAASPLSIQVHPELEQARRGFAAEEARGVDRDAPDRNYRDANHKPEVICALRPFWGLRGFRRVDEIRDEFTTVELASADATIDLPDSESGLQEFFRALLLKREAQRRELIAGALALSSGRWPDGTTNRVPEPGDPLARYYWVLRIAQEYPGDIGILAPLILNVFSLVPGEATYQPAGVLHAYLSGVGVELMANSDNVLRGGMTGKHVDVDELMKVGRFRSEEPVILKGEPERTDGCTVVRYNTPFEEFVLTRIVVESACELPSDTARILFCHEGSVRIRARKREVELTRGESLFAEAAAGMIHLAGTGELFSAAVPE